MRVIAFDPGKVTGYCIMQFHQHDDPEVVDFGEIEFEDLTDKYIRDIIDRCSQCVIEGAVLTGKINQDKVKQLRATERINFYWDSIMSYRNPVMWIQPESKKLAGEVPRHIKGQHAKDAYRILDAWRKMEDTNQVRMEFD